MTAPTAPMPAVFFGHGSPMNTLARNRYTDAWRALGAALPRPKAILAISAHWYTHGTAVTATAAPRTIHDFGGFPRELFEVQYPAPGEPALAARVRELLAPLPVALDHDWGLDHGTWSVLAHAFPGAGVPVVQLSIDRDRPPRWHYELGVRLAPLRAEGVLILGSGNVVHNLGRMQWDEGARPYDWAQHFNERVRTALTAGDHATLVDYAALETAQLSVPTPEHYLPLLYVIATQQPGERVSLPVDGIEYGSIGMLTAAVGAREISDSNPASP
jgi:4,5-DOPA dioxygenase extradiol